MNVTRRSLPLSAAPRLVALKVRPSAIGSWSDGTLAFQIETSASDLRDLERDVKAKRQELRQLARKARQRGWSDTYIAKLARISRVGVWMWRTNSA